MVVESMKTVKSQLKKRPDSKSSLILHAQIRIRHSRTMITCEIRRSIKVIAISVFTIRRPVSQREGLGFQPPKVPASVHRADYFETARCQLNSAYDLQSNGQLSRGIEYDFVILYDLDINDTLLWSVRA